MELEGNSVRLNHAGCGGMGAKIRPEARSSHGAAGAANVVYRLFGRPDAPFWMGQEDEKVERAQKESSVHAQCVLHSVPRFCGYFIRRSYLNCWARISVHIVKNSSGLRDGRTTLRDEFKLRRADVRMGLNLWFCLRGRLRLSHRPAQTYRVLFQKNVFPALFTDTGFTCATGVASVTVSDGSDGNGTGEITCFTHKSFATTSSQILTW